MLNPKEPFNYDEAFSRNIGWVTKVEQEALRGKRVAIAGLGGVGGVHFLTLTRLGVGRFAIADPDRFDLVNFNRQVGARRRRWADPRHSPCERVFAALAAKCNPAITVAPFGMGTGSSTTFPGA